MKWEVKGVNKRTGQDEVVTVFGRDQADAEDQAGIQGVLIESMRELESPPPPPPTIPRGMNTWETILFALLIIFGCLGIAAGWLGSLGGGMDYGTSYPSLYGSRFDGSFAAGATANAIEHLAMHGGVPSGLTAPIVGALLWILAALISINAHVRDAARAARDRSE